ncbi:MAG TPA: hypothetical protein VMS00_06315 [Acidimicrobiales bacterium]|nr:hypothetical protein [Acidimicrobiales bacterium]
MVEPDDADGLDAEALVVVVPPALATPGLCGSPPQAVTTIASAASPTIAAPARRVRARCRFVPSVTWSWPDHHSRRGALASRASRVPASAQASRRVIC